MASYKVAQDVEADDKLIGPFSFKQFVYLLVALGAGFLSWGLSTILLPLFIIPLPIMLIFGTLALPLKKDQPMETYIAAILSFHIKPKTRIWKRDGIMSIIEINAPKTEDKIHSGYLGEYETDRRLAFLSNIADTKGWAIRNTTEDSANGIFSDDIYVAATQAPDMLDKSGEISQNLDTMITDTQEHYKQELLQKMRAPQQQPTAPQQVSSIQPQQDYYAQTQNQPVQPAMDTYQQPTPPQQQPAINANPQVNYSHQDTPTFNPYPSNMQQTVLQPTANTQTQQVQYTQQMGEQYTPALQYTTPQQAPVQDPLDQQHHEVNNSPPTKTLYDTIVDDAREATRASESTSEEALSPDIIELANEKNLSIQTIQDQADKRSKKKKDDEVFISLH